MGYRQQPCEKLLLGPTGKRLSGSFSSETTNPCVFAYSLLEIIAGNLDARRQVVKKDRISRNRPGV